MSPPDWLKPSPYEHVDFSIMMPSEVSRAIAAWSLICRGKSGLQRAGCRLTAGRCEAMDSATESVPPRALVWGKGEKVR